MAFITDPISDMIVRIKNASQRKHKQVSMPHSTKKEAILKIVKEQGFINDFEVVTTKDKKKELTVSLKYKGNTPVITDIKRISKPGLRVYVEAANVPSVLSGYGVAIISTSKGLLTDKQARKENVGGEVIAFVW
ncbi:30S ribosomal protein S8 [Mycoplasmopsis californica]|uniref:Small ribosomal subunit protein uS8 n=1 Tax=Mycoplasmopsis equigenitalium TaxID=114883 RepID=A0ABY5J1G4_9BACT|nr:30S ribosomal protein S8 [Mycoplasmopsis equigenitalium]UUD37097.1 30S ribosomal protein S8 [Mycoplasmopsis equigenitalium]VEU69600.1 30S ribosomal protein S8 [Mycoplasmopsis californica]